MRALHNFSQFQVETEPAREHFFNAIHRSRTKKHKVQSLRNTDQRVVILVNMEDYALQENHHQSSRQIIFNRNRILHFPRSEILAWERPAIILTLNIVETYSNHYNNKQRSE
jgi:hypothetical protein